MTKGFFEAFQTLAALEQKRGEFYLVRVRESLEVVQLDPAATHDFKILYVIFCEASRRVKIGITEDIGKRFKELQAASPTELRVIDRFVVDGVSVETYLHKKFAHCNNHGEWFEWTDDLMKEIGPLRHFHNILNAAWPDRVASEPSEPSEPTSQTND